MLQFGRLLSFPLTFKNLEPKIRELDLKYINAIEENGNISVDSMVNKHNVQLIIYSEIINSSAPVKCYCTCEQFKFSNAYSLYKVNSLIHPEKFILRPPKQKNTSMTLSGCKHIILVSRTLYQNRNIIKKNNI